MVVVYLILMSLIALRSSACQQYKWRVTISHQGLVTLPIQCFERAYGVIFNEFYRAIA